MRIGELLWNRHDRSLARTDPPLAPLGSERPRHASAPTAGTHLGGRRSADRPPSARFPLRRNLRAPPPRPGCRSPLPPRPARDRRAPLPRSPRRTTRARRSELRPDAVRSRRRRGHEPNRDRASRGSRSTRCTRSPRHPHRAAIRPHRETDRGGRTAPGRSRVRTTTRRERSRARDDRAGPSRAAPSLSARVGPTPSPTEHPRHSQYGFRTARLRLEAPPEFCSAGSDRDRTRPAPHRPQGRRVPPRRSPASLANRGRGPSPPAASSRETIAAEPRPSPEPARARLDEVPRWRRRWTATETHPSSALRARFPHPLRAARSQVAVVRWEPAACRPRPARSSR